ncbi:LmrA/YxaF family transcription factor [Nocardia acidivorans]|uniref:LmrA/YxaF family transcription factor n=1 Tax=Nocardia acidivorans TaxID=404580 RepID=UPI0035A250C1
MPRRRGGGQRYRGRPRAAPRSGSHHRTPHTAIAASLTATGRPDSRANHLATPIISSVEGAIILCRIGRSTQPGRGRHRTRGAAGRHRGAINRWQGPKCRCYRRDSESIREREGGEHGRAADDAAATPDRRCSDASYRSFRIAFAAASSRRFLGLPVDLSGPLRRNRHRAALFRCSTDHLHQPRAPRCRADVDGDIRAGSGARSSEG